MDRWNKSVNKQIAFYKANTLYFTKYKKRLDNYQREITIMAKQFDKNKLDIAKKVQEYAMDIGIDISLDTVLDSVSKSKRFGNFCDHLYQRLNYIKVEIFDLKEDNSFGNLKFLAELEMLTQIYKEQQEDRS